MSDPIASPTLARLYLAQGHGGRARAVIEELLARDATDGEALVLRERLGQPGAQLGVRVTAERIEITWQGIAAGPGAYVVLLTTSVQADALRRAVTSAPCSASARGRITFPRPAAPGALAVCIGHMRDGRFVPLVVANARALG